MFARIVAVLAVLVLVAAMLSGLGSRWEWWTFRTGFTILRWAVYVGIALVPLAIVAMFVYRPGGGRRGFGLAFLALLIALAVVGNTLRWRQRAQSVPRIHDITTDTENPPQFVEILRLRADAPNPAEYAGDTIAAQQREGYPDIQPLYLNEPLPVAFQRALNAARDMGWEIVAADSAAGRIEATDETFWYGFKDDVVIRLTPESERTRVDVRSVSRVGGSDVGTNAERIRSYLARLQ